MIVLEKTPGKTTTPKIVQNQVTPSVNNLNF